MNPGGHLQRALWLFTVHSAVGAQGLSVEQGFIQALFLQAWLNAHSSSLAQPISIGAAKLKQKLINIILSFSKGYCVMLTYFITANHSISCVAFKTNAAHSSRRSGRMNSTCCLWYTWRNCWTWINTFVSATRLVTDLKRCTIHINSTILFLYYWFRSYFVKRRKGLRTMFLKILLSS